MLNKLKIYIVLVAFLFELKLHPDPSSKTQTFISRLAALWNNVQDSRRKFEQLPDRGMLKNKGFRIFVV